MHMNYGTFEFNGKLYSDNICLYQPRNDRQDSTGKLCVKDQYFLAVDEVVGSFQANGILGLGPGKDRQESFVS